MNEQIIGQLKKFKSIEPDPIFMAGSRRTILALRKESRVFAWPNFRMAGAFAGLVAILTASIFLFSGRSATEALASPEVLASEFANLNVNIELQEISYRQDVNRTITSAISEISSDSARHLNEDVLNSENEKLNLDESGTDPQIDRLLDELIF